MESNQALWVSKHYDKVKPYAGKWIAVVNNQVAAVADNIIELMAIYNKSNNKAEPLVIKIPRPDEGEFIL
ncbi:hypothetical protein JXI42_10985 [bacterium]|nr:hypothetical protein [bacterium]